MAEKKNRNENYFGILVENAEKHLIKNILQREKKYKQIKMK